MQKILRSRWLVRILVCLPFINLIRLILQQKLGANPLEFLLHSTGEIALTLLLVTLWISPLDKLLPSKIPIRVLNIHKRILGVSAFLYAVIHFSLYSLDQGDWDTYLDGFEKPFIIIGFTSFILLLIMASTSFDAVIKKMGKRNWKKLHRIVYVVLILLVLHISVSGKGNYVKAALIFTPLIIAQLLRFYKYKRRNASSYSKG